MQKIIFSFFILLPFLSFGGVGSSGGGLAVVCRDKELRIVRAITLDLYEAVYRYQLKLISSTGDLEKDYLSSVKNTYRIQGKKPIEVDSEVRENLQRFLAIIEFTSHKLPRLNDMGETIGVPAGCSLEQLAIFEDDTQTVKVDLEIWSALNSLNQAALVSHELLYHYERTLGESSSEGTRASVAHMFSSNAIPVLSNLPSQAIYCSTLSLENDNPRKNSSFYVIRGKNSVQLRLFYIMGRPVLNLATVTLKGIQWETKTEVAGKYTRELVDELGQEKNVRVPILGSQRRDQEIIVNYSYKKPIKIGLLQKGVLIEEAYVNQCEVDDVSLVSYATKSF